MKRRELISLIEKIVRNEVKKYVNEIFINDTNNEIKLTELTKKVISLPTPKRKKSKKEFIKYTDNKLLNEIMNNMEGGIIQENQLGDDIAEIQQKLRESQPGMQSTLTNNSDSQEKRDIAAIKTIQDARVKVDDIPDHVTNALTRDYSKLIKHIYKK